MAEEKLFTLIKSLTKNEKGYFKKWSTAFGSQNALYINLFDEISKQNNFDEELLRSFVQKKSPSLQFHVLKNYLYKQILKSVVQYHFENDNIYILFAQIQILAQKGLYMQCMDLLNSTGKIAIMKEDYLTQLYVIRWAKEIYYLNIKVPKLIQFLLLKEKRLLKNIDIIFQYQTLLNLVNDLRLKKGFLTSEAENEKINKLEKDSLIKSDKHIFDYQTKLFYLEIKFMLAFIKNNEFNMKKYILPLTNTLNNKKAVNHISDSRKTELLKCLIRFSRTFKAYPKIIYYSNVLSNVINNDKCTLPKSKIVYLNSFIFSYKIDAVVDKKHEGEFNRLFEEIDAFIKLEKAFIPVEFYLTLYGNYVVFYLESKKYNKVLKYTNNVLQYSAGKTRIDIASICIIASLIACLELKDWGLYKSKLMSFSYFIKKNNIKNEQQLALLDYFKQLNEKLTKEECIKLSKTAHKIITSCNYNAKNDLRLILQIILDWLNRSS